MRQHTCLPELSFKDYCTKYFQSIQPNKHQKVKSKFVLGDLQTNKLDQKHKTIFKKFIDQAINQTKQIRLEATKEATKTFGNPDKWMRANKNYFKSVEQKHRTSIENNSPICDSEFQFSRCWRINEQIFKKKQARSLSVTKSPLRSISSRSNQYNQHK